MSVRFLSEAYGALPLYSAGLQHASTVIGPRVVRPTSWLALRRPSSRASEGSAVPPGLWWAAVDDGGADGRAWWLRDVEAAVGASWSG